VLKYDNEYQNTKYRHLIKNIFKFKQKLYRKNVRRLFEFYSKFGIFSKFNEKKLIETISIN